MGCACVHGWVNLWVLSKLMVALRGGSVELGHQSVSLTTLLSFPVDGVPVLPRLRFLMSVCELLSSSYPAIPPPLPSHLLRGYQACLLCHIPCPAALIGSIKSSSAGFRLGNIPLKHHVNEPSEKISHKAFEPITTWLSHEPLWLPTS